MKLMFMFILTYTVGICSYVFSHRVRRFVGGQDARRGQFPYIVSLRRVKDNKHFCGGSIIRPKYILTAAHCLRGKSRQDYYIITGINYVYAEGNRYYPEMWAVHIQNYRNSPINDIAIIKLKRGLEFSKTIQKIPVLKSEPPIGVPMTISGWGFQFYGGFVSPTLQYSNVTTIPLKKCRRQMDKFGYGKYVTKRHICTYVRPNIGSCHGDSGGPLVYKGKLVGIVSWSVYCAAGFPDVYVKLSAYGDWLEKTIKQLSTVSV